MTTPADIARVLQDLPARYPRLITLVWELLGEDGLIDAEKAGFRAMEIEEAIEEASALKTQSHNLLQAILRCSRESDR